MAKNISAAREIPVEVATDLPLPLITRKPVERPLFTSTEGHSLASWVVANDLDLCEYWHDLGEPEEGDCTFAEFCAIQYDRQAEVIEDYTRADYEADEADARYGCES